MKTVLNYILFYGILMPLSLLPMWFLYVLSSLIRLLLCYVIKYRKDIIASNLANSFPEKSKAEINHLINEYYAHLADLLVEAVKMLTISKKNLLRRYRCINPELPNAFYEQGRSIVLASAHYNNWEYMVASLDMQISHHGVGVGKRMSNKTFELLAFKKRTRYGTEVCYADNVRSVMETYNKERIPCAYMLLSDQSPNNSKKCYWASFLNQPTALIYGAEYFAKKYDFPVLFYRVEKRKRGRYEVRFEIITATPRETQYGRIIEDIASRTEDMIRKNPRYWLWSHRRWKLKPEVSEPPTNSPRS